MTTPIPGRAVRGSATGKPIMALLDELGRTWSLGILWNLNCNTLSFRELQSHCEKISPTLLNKRLKELRELQLVAHSSSGYHLTSLGNELFCIVKALGPWSDKWSKQLKGENCNAS